MINKNTKNIFAKDYIYLQEENYKDVFTKFGIVTLKDLETRINDGTIKDKSLENLLEDKTLGIGLKLSEISTDSLRFDQKTSDLLDELNIENFQQLIDYINETEKENQVTGITTKKIVNPVLKSACELAKIFIEQANDNKKSR